MTYPEPRASRRPFDGKTLAILAVAAALFVFAALHITATAAAHRAETSGPLAKRVASARLAARLEPWNPTFVRRSRVMTLWELGQRQLASGDYNRAVDTLRAAYRDDVGNTDLLDLFKEAQATQALETNRKAHLQHGHEGPGGTLRPEDIER